MAWSEIGGATSYPKYNESKAGDVLVEGWYTGPKQGKYGIVHYFKTPEDKNVGLNKAGHLDWALEQISIGDYVRIVYDGKEVLEKGDFKGVNAHRFKVYQDASKRGQAPSAPVDATQPEDNDPLSA